MNINDNGIVRPMTPDEISEFLASLPPPPTRAQNIATVLAEARTMRSKLFSVVDGLQASALATGNSADATAIEAFKVGLRNITSVSFTTVPENLSQEETLVEMRKVVKLAYATITAPAPASVKAAFKAAQS